MAAAAGSTHGGAWEQQPLSRLQSAPVTLHLTSADSVRSSTGCVYMYAALQDKSLHKYKVVVPTTMPAAKAKVRLISSITLLIDLCCGPRLHAALGVLLPVHANLTDIDAIPSETCKHPHSDFKHQHANCKGVVSTARRDEASGGMQQLTRSCIVAQYTHSALKAHCHLRLAERQHLPCTLLMQVLPLLSPERGFPVQKGCRALLLDKLGCLLAAASDGCCYLLDAESLHQDARLVLHPSQTGLPVPCSCCTNNPVCNCTCQKLDGASICVL